MIPRFLPPAVYVLYYLLLLRVSETVNMTKTPVIRLLYIKKVKGFCRCNQVPNQLTEFFKRAIIFGGLDLIR